MEGDPDRAALNASPSGGMFLAGTTEAGSLGISLPIDYAEPPVPNVKVAIRGASIDEALGVRLIRELVVATDRCWLCATPFSATKPSDDHIFNRWLLRWRDLHDKQFVLSNRSFLRFSQARVGTCTDCNNVHLSRIERRVAEAAKAGFREFAALPRGDILLWLAKMHFGLLRLELRLPADVKSPDGGTILTEDFFQSPIGLKHLLLQEARGVVRVDPSPGSVLLFEVEPGPGNDFEYHDMIDPMFIALRMGSIGIVATLQDWGWLEETWTQFATPSPPIVPIGSTVSTAAFFDITTTAMVLARSTRGAPQVLISDDDDGTIVVTTVPEMNPGVGLAVRAEAEGQPLPFGFRPCYRQFLDIRGLENLGDALQARRRDRTIELKRREEHKRQRRSP